MSSHNRFGRLLQCAAGRQLMLSPCLALFASSPSQYFSAGCPGSRAAVIRCRRRSIRSPARSHFHQQRTAATRQHAGDGSGQRYGTWPRDGELAAPRPRHETRARRRRACGTSPKTAQRFGPRQRALERRETAVTAHDFVFAWRKIVDPANASEYAFFLFPLKNAEASARRQANRVIRACMRSMTRRSSSTSNHPTAIFEKPVAYGTFAPIRQDFYEATQGRHAAPTPTRCCTTGRSRSQRGSTARICGSGRTRVLGR